MIGAAVVLFAALGLCLNAFTTPVYRATVRIEFPRPADRSAWTGQSGETGSYQSENQSLYTTAELISSRTLLGRLAGTLSSAELEGVLAMQGIGMNASWIAEVFRNERAGTAPGVALAAGSTAAPAAGSTAAIDPGLMELAIDGLRQVVSVEPVRDTRLVDLKVEFTTPEGARDLADRLARLFVRYAGEQAAEQDSSGLAFLAQRLADVKRRLAMPEGDRSATEGTSTAASRARVARLQETDTGLGTACAGVEADRLAVRARLSRLRTIAARGPEAWVHEPIESEALEALRHAVVDCETRLAAARAIYLERHPKLIALEKERADLLSKMREEVPRAITALEGQESVLAAREAELRDAQSRTERELADADDDVRRGTTREAERKADEDLEVRLLTAVQDREIEPRMRTPPALVVDAAMCDPDPVRPRRALNLAVCVLAGLLAGAGIAMLGPQGRPIRDPRRLEEELGLPVVAAVAGKALAEPR